MTEENLWAAFAGETDTAMYFETVTNRCSRVLRVVNY